MHRNTPDTYVCRKLEKSAEAERNISTNHRIDFSGTAILHRTPGYVDRLVKEATEIDLDKNNFNSGECLILSQAWSTVSNMSLQVKAGRTEQVPVSSHKPSFLATSYEPENTNEVLYLSLQMLKFWVCNISFVFSIVYLLPDGSGSR